MPTSAECRAALLVGQRAAQATAGGAACRPSRRVQPRRGGWAHRQRRAGPTGQQQRARRGRLRLAVPANSIPAVPGIHLARAHSRVLPGGSRGPAPPRPAAASAAPSAASADAVVRRARSPQPEQWWRRGGLTRTALRAGDERGAGWLQLGALSAQPASSTAHGRRASISHTPRSPHTSISTHLGESCQPHPARL